MRVSCGPAARRFSALFNMPIGEGANFAIITGDIASASARPAYDIYKLQLCGVALTRIS